MTVTDLVEVKEAVRVNAYRVIADAVWSGIGWGWQHAHKHTDQPGEHHIKERLYNDIMDELCEVLEFDD